jgi:hypothetical protein
MIQRLAEIIFRTTGLTVVSVMCNRLETEIQSESPSCATRGPFPPTVLFLTFQGVLT